MTQVINPPPPPRGTSAVGPPVFGTPPDGGALVSYSSSDHGHGLPQGALGTTSPSGRYEAAMAQLSSGEVLLFGGDLGGGNMANDTWLWTGGNWVLQAPATSPPGRYEAVMAQLSTGEVLLFGGAAPGTSDFLSDTWLWSNGNWVEQSPGTVPPGRNEAVMAQLSTGEVLLFGGYGPSSTYLDDTWAWSNGDWVKQSPATSPSGRGEAVMAQLSQGQLLLSQGYDGGALLTDTWLWSNGNWVEQSPATVPTGRFGAMMAQLDSGKVVMFGGNTSTSGNPNLLNDTWLWSNGNWVEQSPATSPPVRSSAVMAQLDSGELLLCDGFGGSPTGNSAYLGDNWIYTGGDWGQVQFAVTSLGAVYEVELTTATATGLLSFTPARSGMFVINLYFRIATAATTLSISVATTDAAGAQTFTPVDVTLQAVGSYAQAPLVIAGTAGQPITISATAGTANQAFVSAAITTGG